jgi:uncharacterized protein with PhoU and TrkA domain
MPGDHERLERFSTMTPRLRGRRELVAFTRRLGQLGIAIAALLLAGTAGFVLTRRAAPRRRLVRSDAPADTTLCPGDVLMALGTPNTLDRLEALFVTARATPVP